MIGAGVCPDCRLELAGNASTKIEVVAVGSGVVIMTIGECEWFDVVAGTVAFDFSGFKEDCVVPVELQAMLPASIGHSFCIACFDCLVTCLQ